MRRPPPTHNKLLQTVSVPPLASRMRDAYLWAGLMHTTAPGTFARWGGARARGAWAWGEWADGKAKEAKRKGGGAKLRERARARHGLRAVCDFERLLHPIVRHALSVELVQRAIGIA